MESSITFSKCKRGESHVFYYFDDQTCSKLFINPDHLKIIVYDGFKLPINKLQKYLKELGFVIYREVLVNNKGNSSKMFRIIGTTTTCTFHELKNQFPNHMTCCLNDNGLKIPGIFQMSEILNLSKNMIEFFKKLETEVSEPFISVVEATQPVAVAVVVEAPKPVAVAVVEEPKPVVIVVEAPKPVAVVVEAPQPVAVVVEAPKPVAVVVEAEKLSVIDEEETIVEVSNLAENKLLYAESELRIAQFKHNISYLEWCIEEEMKYRNTLKI